MLGYLLKRLLLIIPTLFVILLLNFVIVQLAPSGPIEQKIAQIEKEKHSLHAQGFGLAQQIRYRDTGLSDEMMAELRSRYGFDKPAHQRFWQMIVNYARFDLGQSFFKGQSVGSLLAEKLPNTLIFGAFSLLTMYGLGLFLGVLKALKHGSYLDKVSTLMLAILHALPSFALALILLMFFAGARFWQIFPMQGLTSDNFATLSWLGKLKDVLYHLMLPTLASALGSVAGITYLSKYNILQELSKTYVTALTSKGLDSFRIHRQVVKNSLLPVLSEMPMALTGLLFVGNFLIEIIFNIDGLGRLAYEAVLFYDYPVMFGLLYVFSLMMMAFQLIFDVLYKIIDPRVVF